MKGGHRALLTCSHLSMAGEAGLKQRAKTIDSNLSVIVHDILDVAVQRNLEEVLALSDSLTSILLCKGEVHDLGLKVS